MTIFTVQVSFAFSTTAKHTHPLIYRHSLWPQRELLNTFKRNSLEESYFYGGNSNIRANYGAAKIHRETALIREKYNKENGAEVAVAELHMLP